MPTLQLQDLVARYVKDRDYIRKQKRPRPKTKIFLPRSDEKAGELALSTFDIGGLSKDEIWKLGRDTLGAATGRSIKGRCDLPIGKYRNEGLSPHYDDNPERHVNILGWPTTEADRLSIAQELAASVQEQGVLETTEHY